MSANFAKMNENHDEQGRFSNVDHEWASQQMHGAGAGAEMEAATNILEKDISENGLDKALAKADIADALGIVTKPALLCADHCDAIDEIHDLVGALKDGLQAKNNYVASSHLTEAQRHLKDAKATLITAALNPDTKHVLAQSAIGKASKALTQATRSAGGTDKAVLASHNAGLQDFVANPSKTFTKMNENHDEKGRFASGDGGGGDGAGSSGASNSSPTAQVESLFNAFNDDYINAVKSYRAEAVAVARSGQLYDGGLALDMNQTRDDAANWLTDAHDATKEGDRQATISALSGAVEELAKDEAFGNSLRAINSQISAYRSMSDGEFNSKSKNKSLNPVIAKALEIAKMNENHDEAGRFSSGGGDAKEAKQYLG